MAEILDVDCRFRIKTRDASEAVPASFFVLDLMADAAASKILLLCNIRDVQCPKIASRI